MADKAVRVQVPSFAPVHICKKVGKLIRSVLRVVLFCIILMIIYKNKRVDFFELILLTMILIPDNLWSKLTKLKLSKDGIDMDFENELKKIDSEIQLYIEGSKKKLSKTFNGKTFDLEMIKEELKTNKLSALILLEKEIETKLESAVNKLGLKTEQFNLYEYVNLLYRKFKIDDYQKKVLILIIDKIELLKRNWEKIYESDVKKIINQLEEINERFSFAYSLNSNPNENYKESGYCCKWEHCIEQMPLENPRTDESCPVFGHTCPGGVKEVKECEHSYEDEVDKVLGIYKNIHFLENDIEPREVEGEVIGRIHFKGKDVDFKNFIKELPDNYNFSFLSLLGEEQHVIYFGENDDNFKNIIYSVASKNNLKVSIWINYG